MPDTFSYISPFALSDGSDGPPFSNHGKTANIQELALPTIVCLSGKPDDKDLPATNGIIQLSDSRSIFALAPDQWLICDTAMTAEEVMAETRERYSTKTIVCADHSQAWSALRLSGTDATKVLSRLCPADLHPEAFAGNTLIQTNMASMYILCRHTPDEANSFDLYMSHSYSRAFYEALRDAVEIG